MAFEAVFSTKSGFWDEKEKKFSHGGTKAQRGREEGILFPHLSACGGETHGDSQRREEFFDRMNRMIWMGKEGPAVPGNRKERNES